jgi:hypothetical protein
MEANRNRQDRAAANASANPVVADAPSAGVKEETKADDAVGNEFSAGNTVTVESSEIPVPDVGEAPAAPLAENEFAAKLVASVAVADVPAKDTESDVEESERKEDAKAVEPKDEGAKTKAENSTKPSTDNDDETTEARVKDTPLYDELLAAKAASMDATGARFPKRARKQLVDIQAEEREKQKKKKEAADKVAAEAAAEAAEAARPPPDVHEGRYVEQSKLLGTTTGQFYPLNGKIVEFRPQEGRIPGRYAIQWEHPSTDGKEAEFILEDEWVQEDLDAFEEAASKGSTPITTYSAYKSASHSHHPPPLKMALDNVRQRYQQVVEQNLNENHVLSTLIVMAALEEALQSSLQQQLQWEDSQIVAGTTTSTKRSSTSKPHPPLYYAANPSSYLQPPSDGDGGSLSSSAFPKTQMTPAVLAQRVRQGCQWAWTLLQSQQHTPPLLAAPVAKRFTEGTIVANVDDPLDVAAIVSASCGGSSVAQRRSVRAVRVASYAEDVGLDISRTRSAPGTGEPSPVQKGGRIAMWWLKELEVNRNVKPADVEQVCDDEAKMEESPTAKPKGKKGKQNKKNDNNVAGQASFKDSEPEADTKDDNDDDYSGGDDQEDDDESLENVERERNQLSPVPDPDADEEMEDDEGEVEQADEEHAIEWDNPYLPSSFPALLEYLARPKSITLEEVQKAMDEIMVKVRFNKRIADHGIDVSLLSIPDEVALNIEKPNHPSTGIVVLKCVSGESAGELQRLDANTFGRCKFELDVIGDEEMAIQAQRKEELMQQEIEYKERKAWDRWRFKGIHEGCAVWPNWEDSALAWVKENVSSDIPSAASLPAESEETKNDEALAKSLEETEIAGGGRRRTARRAAASATEGVFYGNQSGLSQKQLTDALLRLIRTSSFQTLMKLQSLVADDSSDPIRRYRIVLGKMLWKQNIVGRKAVFAGVRDDVLQQELTSKKPLLTMQSLEVGDQTAGPISGSDVDIQDLIMYLSSLHETELKLRDVLLKHLDYVPIPVIATAADERVGSLENLDDNDFEDLSKIEWKTTGHALVGKLIYRPPNQSTLGKESTMCYWYKVIDYSESIESEEDDTEENAMERRKRFRAEPSEGPGGDFVHDGEVLLLTEAQVHAGEKAGQMQRQQQMNASKPNPYARVTGDTITLTPIDSDAFEISGRIVGHDSIEDGSEVEYRILFLPTANDETGEQEPPFWAVLDEREDDAAYVCQPVGQSTWYALGNQKFLEDTDAYNECEKILNWLSNQSKAAPFMTPVDPVALGIPSYPEIVKHPMDISTIVDKLEHGHYASVPPGQSFGRSPTCQMLNGPFRKDIELMFNNAILFNPPDDWIHQAAQSLKKSALKKIETASSAAERAYQTNGGRQNRSMYVYEDSDQDMYEYESDQDEEYGGRRRKRKRDNRASTNKDEAAARPLEHTIRLNHVLKDGNDLRGPFSDFPINTDANTFSMPPGWSCRKRIAAATAPIDASEEADKNGDETLSEEEERKQELAREMADLLSLQKTLGDNESHNLRRSTRAQHEPGQGADSGQDAKITDLEYFTSGSEVDVSGSPKLPTSRLDVEILREVAHEERYSKLFMQHEKRLVATGKYGIFANSSFPPYLGRMAPFKNRHGMLWEIRSDFAVPALRWVIRGLINSGHLTATEPMTSDVTSGVVIKNDIYYWDPKQQPFEVLDVRGLQRRKRAGNIAEEEEEDDYEMSEYERLRAERVARNAERLKALGLA